MSAPLSHRATIATFIGLAVAVIVVTSLFVWPGYLRTSHSCATSGAPTEFTNAGTYCYSVVPLPPSVPYNPNGTYSNWTVYSQWGYTFGLIHPFALDVGILDVRIAEPFAGPFATNLVYSYGHPIVSVVAWFTPDNSSGVIVFNNLVSVNVSLLVRS